MIFKGKFLPKTAGNCHKIATFLPQFCHMDKTGQELRHQRKELKNVLKVVRYAFLMRRLNTEFNENPGVLSRNQQ